jgi:hypothetical protein
MTPTLPHYDNECQLSINNAPTGMWSNQGNKQILEHIRVLLTTFIGHKTKYGRRNPDSKMIDIANWKAWNMGLLDVK